MSETFILTFKDLLGGGAFLILLIFVIYDKFFSKRTRDHEQADSKLVKIFHETINRLETNQQDMQLQMDIMEKELHKIKGENEYLIKIFQGRDEGFLAYQKKGLDIMEKVEKEVIPLLYRIDNKIK